MTLLALLAAAHAEPLALSFDDALGRAGERAVSVREAHADVRSAEGAVLSARSLFEPQLSLSGAAFSSTDEGQFQFGNYYVDTSGWNTSATLTQPLVTGTSLSVGFGSSYNKSLYRIEGVDSDFEGDPAWSTDLTFSISQSLLQGTRLAYNLQTVRAARRARTVAEANRQAVRQQALADAARAYWTVHYQRRLVAIADQTLSLATEQARIVDALVEAGKLAPVEHTRIAAARAQAERARLDADAAAATATDGLLLLLGEAPGQDVVLTSTPPAPTPLDLDEARVMDAVQQGNPSLLALTIAADNADVAVKDAKHALLPSLVATGSYGIRGYETSFSGSMAELGAGDLPEWSVGGQLSLPVFALADRGALEQRQAEAERARLTLEATRGTLLQQARAQVRVIENARRAVELATLDVSLGEETLRAEQARLGEGRALQKDVVQAIKDLDTARAGYEKTLADYAVALIELRRLQGTL